MCLSVWVISCIENIHDHVKDIFHGELILLHFLSITNTSRGKKRNFMKSRFIVIQVKAENAVFFFSWISRIQRSPSVVESDKKKKSKRKKREWIEFLQKFSIRYGITWPRIRGFNLFHRVWLLRILIMCILIYSDVDDYVPRVCMSIDVEAILCEGVQRQG